MLLKTKEIRKMIFIKFIVKSIMFLSFCVLLSREFELNSTISALTLLDIFFYGISIPFFLNIFKLIEIFIKGQGKSLSLYQKAKVCFLYECKNGKFRMPDNG